MGTGVCSSGRRLATLAPPFPPIEAMVELPRTSARLSSTYYTYSYQSGSCIDGMYTNMCISGWESEPWLEVDLGSEYHVDMVVVYNPQDCCMERLGQYEIWVGSLTQAPSALCASTTAPASAGPFSSMCGAIGRYVTVRLPGSYRQLALAELMVYSEPANMPPPPSAPPASPPPAPRFQPFSFWLGPVSAFGSGSAFPSSIWEAFPQAHSAPPHPASS